MPYPKYIKKRTGELEKFNPKKIQAAIQKAINAVNEKADAKELAKKVIKSLKIFKIPGVEEIQDVVENVLSQKHERVAKAYILYRKARAHARNIKNFFKIKDDLKLNVNAIKVLEERYLLKNKKGEVVETPTQLFKRVAKAVAAADAKYGKNVKETEKAFFEVMKNLEFLPNSPTLMNAGTSLQLSACFVLPVEDSLVDIFNAVKYMALIQQSGGGTGFSFSHLRPRGDLVKSTYGVASGPVSFMKIFDEATETIKQAGKRRGANMAVLNCQHPDILDFITAKTKPVLNNFNLSVAVTNSFMKAVKARKNYNLINPRTGKPVRKLNAYNVFNLIAFSAWQNGDPGMLFIDEINRKHPLREKIEATNPCGEQPLLPYESCNLGSINLSKFITKGKIDWQKLQGVIKTAVHFLDNVIDVNPFPLKQIKKVTEANRKIGLGVMGFADMLIQLGIPYNSQKALKLAEKLMKFIQKTARKKSEELGRQRGSFPNFKKSKLKNKYKFMRNATCTTVAPTGTISIIAGCSSGIEPLFAVSFIRNVMQNVKLLEVNYLFENMAIRQGFYSQELMKEIAKKGSIQKIKKIPKAIKKIFVTALDIKPEWHVKMQAAFQRHVDNAVSKTVNLPHNATKKDIAKIYWLAYKLKCKGITVYRYGSRSKQVLYIGSVKPLKPKYTKAEVHYSGGCIGGPYSECVY